MNTDAESNPLAQNPTQGPDSQSISYTVGLLKLIFPLCIIRNGFAFFISVSCWKKLNIYFNFRRLADPA